MKDFDDIEEISRMLAIIAGAVILFTAAAIGYIVAESRHEEMLNSVGIDKIVEHETVVDGNVVTNWNEIVWKEKGMK